MISATVVTVNRLVWRKLYRLAETAFPAGDMRPNTPRLLPRGYRVGFNFVASFGKMHACEASFSAASKP